MLDLDRLNLLYSDRFVHKDVDGPCFLILQTTGARNSAAIVKAVMAYSLRKTLWWECRGLNIAVFDKSHKLSRVQACPITTPPFELETAVFVSQVWNPEA